MRFLFCCVFAFAACTGLKPKPNNPSPTPQPVEPMSDEAYARWLEPKPFSSRLELQTTKGNLKLELYFETGEHRENFTKLLRDSFYNGLLFHRTIKGFMAQTGDPDSRSAKAGAVLGRGGLAYELDAEILTQFVHHRGALAAARKPDEINPLRKSSASQFYVVQGSAVSDEQLDRIERSQGFSYTMEQRALYRRIGGAPQLDGNYSVFGRVYEGFEVIDSLCGQMTDNYDRPKEDIKILRIIELP